MVYLVTSSISQGYPCTSPFMTFKPCVGYKYFLSLPNSTNLPPILFSFQSKFSHHYSPSPTTAFKSPIVILQHSSSPHNVQKDNDGLNTSIHLFGSEEATEKAKSLITSLTEENVRNGSYEFRGHDRQEDTQKKTEFVVTDDDGSCKIDWDKLNLNHEKAQKEKWGRCPVLLKNFYVEKEEVANMSPEEVKKFRKESNNIMVSYVFEEGEENIPNPVKTFEQCFEPFPEIMNEIQKQGFEKPSPIQCQAWPILLKGHDLIGIAQTGTGKTLAFLLPALIHIDRQPVARHERGGANVLVMAPTRELAIQIEKEVSKYSYREIQSVCVYGGGNRREQVTNVRKGVEIIIATPGRLNDLIQDGVIDVTSVTYLVLDEADRMLDLGFEPQIRKILLDIRPDRQTVMTRYAEEI
ncbi:hypothetical protein J437_LFUL001104 [Ladona fulva]|uniref:RNA helicase n=1 Tax=Ladona fulva TaxID=123851 RepID=A0A8K0JWP4_LADFU|nr:hypothetical protein J437_LFUL001104 [Ladona fulva]